MGYNWVLIDQKCNSKLALNYYTCTIETVVSTSSEGLCIIFATLAVNTFSDGPTMLSEVPAMLSEGPTMFQRVLPCSHFSEGPTMPSEVSTMLSKDPIMIMLSEVLAGPCHALRGPYHAISSQCRGTYYGIRGPYYIVLCS